MTTTNIVIPEEIEQLLTPEWLTDALATQFPGTRVTSVTRGPVVERVSTNARFKIEGDLPPDLPPALCAKGYFGPVGKGSAHAGVPEASFYRDLSHAIGVRTLNSVWADVDPDSTRDSQALVDAYKRIASRTPGEGWTIVHGDAHVGNTFLDGAGRACLLDWQVTQWGPWGIDVGYHIASALEPDVRADNERE